jgi:molybdopterin-guanine dinucleotide biosynthesis protein
MLPQGSEPSFWELAAQVPANTSIIIVEGYKRLPIPKIEVLVSGKPDTLADELLAVIQREPDAILNEIPPGIPVYQANEWAQVIGLLVARGMLTHDS